MYTYKIQERSIERDDEGNSVEIKLVETKDFDDFKAGRQWADNRVRTLVAASRKSENPKRYEWSESVG